MADQPVKHQPPMSTNMGETLDGPVLNSGPWTEDEQMRLRRLAEYHVQLAQQNPPPTTPQGEPSLPWTVIARAHGTRNPKQCRERWDNHERYYKKRGPITAEESTRIHNWVALNGRRWAKLSRFIKRPENMIKNHWYQELKKSEGRKNRELAQQQHVHSLQQDHQERHDRIRSVLNRPPSHSHQSWSASPHTPQASNLDYYPQPHQDGYNHPPFHTHDLHSRRQSNVSNPPSLASDNGSSVADSPRSALDTWAPTQLALPPLQQLKPVSSGPDYLQMNPLDRARSLSSQGLSFTDSHHPLYDAHRTYSGTSQHHSRASSHDYYHKRAGAEAYPAEFPSARQLPGSHARDNAYERRPEGAMAGPLHPAHHHPCSSGEVASAHVNPTHRVYDTGYATVERRESFGTRCDQPFGYGNLSQPDRPVSAADPTRSTDYRISSTTATEQNGSATNGNSLNPLLQLSTAAVSRQKENRQAVHSHMSIRFLLNSP